MKFKCFILVMMLVVFTFSLSGCSNIQVIDTTWKFDRAIIKLADGCLIEGKVQSWRDYEESDMIQVKINDTVYLTHSSNVILISD